MNPIQFDGIAKSLAGRFSRRQDGGSATPATPVSTNLVTVDFLFVQQFDSGTWQPSDAGDGTYTLTLTGAAEQTIAFSDAPTRTVTTFPTDDLLGVIGFTPDNLPNAALTVTGPDGHDAIVVELAGIDYDLDANSVTYTATVLPADDSGNLGAIARQQDDAELPAEFGAGSLFIDSVSRVCDNDDCLVTCCGTTHAKCIRHLWGDECNHD